MCVAPSGESPLSAVMLADCRPGAGGTTVTAKRCSALPPAFVAVTVTVALPAATAVSVSWEPDLETWTMPLGDAVTS